MSFNAMQEVQNEHRKNTGSSSDTMIVTDDKPAENGPEAATEIKDKPTQENGSSKASQPLRVLIVAQHVSDQSSCTLTNLSSGSLTSSHLLCVIVGRNMSSPVIISMRTAGEHMPAAAAVLADGRRPPAAEAFQ